MFYFYGAILIIFDIVSKYFATKHFTSQINIFGDFLYIKYITNPGIAFGIPLTGIPLKVLTLIFIGVIFWYYKKEEKPKKQKLIDLSFLLILSGALGNAIERIFVGEVVDFIGIKYFSIFNIADIYISIGVILYIYYLIFLSKKHE